MSLSSEMERLDRVLSKAVHREPREIFGKVPNLVRSLKGRYTSPLQHAVLKSWEIWWTIQAAERAGDWQRLRTSCRAATRRRSRLFKDRIGLYALSAKSALLLGRAGEARAALTRALQLVARESRVESPGIAIPPFRP